MKNFDYTARNQYGATKRGSIQSSDRKSALHTLKLQGLTPVSIQDGTKVKNSLPNKISFNCGLIVLCSVLVLGLCFIWISKDAQKISSKKRNEKIKKLHTETNSKSQLFTVTTNLPIDIKAELLIAPVTNLLAHKPKLITTNSLEYRIALKDGRIGQDGNILPARPAYKSGTEQVISMIANARLGYPPPLLPHIHAKEDVAKILNTDIVIYDDDSTSAIEKKANVAYAKQALKEYLAQGGMADDFLNYYQTELTKAFTEWRESQRLITELVRSGDQETAIKLSEEQNKKFKQRGIRPVVVPLNE